MKQLLVPVNGYDHVYGSPGAAIELVEYGDYQCPYCGRAYPIVKHIQEKMGTNLRFVFRNFPIRRVHPFAVAAAVATEAAGRQDMFWEMHDGIFENQDRLSEDFIIDLAEALGLDMVQFEFDIRKAELRAKVDRDFESGIRSGVNTTPSFFINEQKYEGSWEEEEFISHLEAILKHKELVNAYRKII